MSDSRDELIIRQNRVILYLVLIIALLLICIFMLAYCKPSDNIAICGTGAATPSPAVCGNAVMEANNEDWAMRELGISEVKRDGSKLFKQNCAVCHTINSQKLTGPGLAGIYHRVPAPAGQWLRRYILNSTKFRQTGDAYAQKIFEENGRVEMTSFEGILSEEELDAILVYMVGYSRP